MRLEKMRNETGGETRDSAVLSRMAHEFGVDESGYNIIMSDIEIVEATFNYQTSPSPLEKEIERELKDFQNMHFDGC